MPSERGPSRTPQLGVFSGSYRAATISSDQRANLAERYSTHTAEKTSLQLVEVFSTRTTERGFAKE
jgi:hypothetical protein